MSRHSGQSDAEKHGRRYIDPEFRNRKKAEDKALIDRYNQLCGPVETNRVEPKND